MIGFPSVSSLVEQLGHAEQAQFDFMGMVQVEVTHKSFEYEVDEDGYYTIRFSWGEGNWRQALTIGAETLDDAIDSLISGTEIEFNDPVNDKVVNLWIELRDDRDEEEEAG